VAATTLAADGDAAAAVIRDAAAPQLELGLEAAPRADAKADKAKA